ncbi:MAG: DUF5682 family protein [Pseudomonadota bacterium]
MAEAVPGVDPQAPALHDAARDTYVVPIRHHSPACSAHLERLLAEVQPAAVLVEGPCDFDPLIALLNDELTQPPVAIVSIRKGGGGGDGETGERRATSYFPFCEHSPEFIALRYGAKAGVETRFIDLPSAARAWSREEVEIPSLMSDEAAFDSGDFVRALAAEMGCRDGNEVWDQLFEARISGADWRGFFAEVGQYCACIRAATAPALIEADGTLEREVQMRALITQTRARVDGPIVVLVGGFHAPALADGPQKGDKPIAAKAKDEPGYLVRYGNRQLDALQGYNAGLPMPGFYQRWWDWYADTPGEADPAEWTHAIIGGFAEHLREEGRAPPFPVILAAVEQAQRLAQLRGRDLPFRDDILDAVRSTFVKDEVPRHGARILTELTAWLTGTVIGDVPASAGSPPLVQAVRAEARRLRFQIDDGEIRTRNLDIYRKPAHREASRFCHALDLLSAGFATRTAGPDFRNDVGLDRLFEVWSVNYSPMVEARLVEIAHTGDTVRSALAFEIERRIAALEEQGLGRNALAAIDLFATACRAGIGERAGAILAAVEAEVIEDADITCVIAALADIVLLRRGHEVLGITDTDPLDRLVATTWRRVLALLPELAALPADQAQPILRALADLRGTMEIAATAGFAFDKAPFEAALERLAAAELVPQIDGAVMAFALLDGRADGAALHTRLTGELAGAYVNPTERLAFLGGIIAIAPELLWTLPEVVEALDRVVSDTDEEQFIELMPMLRLALMPLDPRDVDRLSGMVAERLGIARDALNAVVEISEGDALANLELDRMLSRKLETEGLA